MAGCIGGLNTRSSIGHLSTFVLFAQSIHHLKGAIRHPLCLKRACQSAFGSEYLGFFNKFLGSIFLEPQAKQTTTKIKPRPSLKLIAAGSRRIVDETFCSYFIKKDCF